MKKPTNSEALTALFHPRAVAVLGVSEEPTKHNHIAFANAKASSFAGNVYPIHRTLTQVAGAQCYPGPAALPEKADVVFLAIPAAATIEALKDCAEAGITVAIVGSAGYSESGPEGVARQAELAQLVESHGIRLVGPNCNGIYNATIGLSIGFNTAHSKRIKAGDIAILSHSGALFDILVTQLDALDAGMSIFVSAGNEVDFNILDYLDYLVDHDPTRVIALLLDSVPDGRRFRELAQRAHEAGKHIVALKIGRTDVGSQAAMAHSSRMATGAVAYKALFKACGVPLVSSLEGLTTAAAMLSLFGSVDGSLAVLSNSGGGASLLGDLTEELGIPLTQYSADTLTALAPFRQFSHVGNPTDFGAFGARTKAQEVPSIIAADPGVGLFLSQMHAQRSWQRIPTMSALTRGRETSGKPFVLLAPGGLSPEAIEDCKKADIHIFKDTNATLQGIAAVLTRQTRDPGSRKVAAAPVADEELLTLTRPLTEPESLSLLSRFGIATTRTEVCTSLDEALSAAEAIGWPVVLKAVVKGLAHKSDAGLVRVDIEDKAALRQTFMDFGQPDTVAVQPYVRGRLEAIAGITVAEDVGPMLLLGLGGIYAEAINDIAMWSIPVDRQTIRDELARTAVGRIVTSSRWTVPGSLDAIVDTLMKLQSFALWADARIAAVDVNPLVIGEKGVIAVDALVVPATAALAANNSEAAE
ncbi:acyl-CoA synthetase (NDP forming) [Rhizobium sp. BK313]|uniref:acetate--CoA ligase family protein n=1 Tax=Rhizobium sp. BK313 TaxID=2587081 RepID=UPI00105C2B65|nr:acetate--CoA ligase family protein [Rhizobium sp. BK313]MBB3459390.1 acyl-CoA synthetase (NDP forming) [Rhizobium sp. BK313]